MLFTFPSFINKSEQDESRLLYNAIKITLQTSVREIWYDVNFGTKIRNAIKQGIDGLVVTDIQIDIEDNLMKYFQNDIRLNYLDLQQQGDKILIQLDYIELRTGKHNTIQTEETFINQDKSLY